MIWVKLVPFCPCDTTIGVKPDMGVEFDCTGVTMWTDRPFVWWFKSVVFKNSVKQKNKQKIDCENLRIAVMKCDSIIPLMLNPLLMIATLPLVRYKFVPFVPVGKMFNSAPPGNRGNSLVILFVDVVITVFAVVIFADVPFTSNFCSCAPFVVCKWLWLRWTGFQN